MTLARLALAALLSIPRPSVAQDAARAPAAPDFTPRLEALRAEAGLPALGAARITAAGLEGVWVTGTRRAGGTEKVAAGDEWHLGSCTKSMTATLIALLVARGDLAWDTELGELLGEQATEVEPDYLDVTLTELCTHRSGLAGAPDWKLFGELRTSTAPLMEQRETLMLAAFQRLPAYRPREGFQYANDGFVIAGHLAERATKKPWETLMRELLFEPLGMTSAGFGPPGTPETCDQPRGHTPDGQPLEPGPAADNPAAIGPAGTVHASLADWAKYVALHLRGEKGDVKVGEITLTRDAFRRLHAPYPGPGQKYACGWVVESRPWAGGDGTALWHNGSNTMWYCVTWLGPANGVAALVTTNQASPAAAPTCDKAAALLLEEYASKAAPR